MMQRSFTLYGHRGARGLSPENSLPGYATALKNGVDVVDMDVVMTRDHVLVVHHNLALNPDIARDKHGTWVHDSKLISQMTTAELAEYDVGRLRPGTRYAGFFPHQQPVDGTKIPTLLQVIQYIKQQDKKVKFQIEIKNDPDNPEEGYTAREMAEALAEIIHQENIVDCTEVQAFDWQCLYELHRIDPAIITAFLTSPASELRMRNPDPVIAGSWTGGKLLKDYGNSIPGMIKALGGQLWDPMDIEVTPKQLQEAHQLGLKVVTWSAPATSGKDVDLELTRRLIEWGVDGVNTDRPDEVSKLR